MRDIKSSCCRLETHHGLSYVYDDGDLERVVLQNIAPAVRQSVFVSRPIVPARKTVDRGPVLQRFRAAPARSINCLLSWCLRCFKGSVDECFQKPLDGTGIEIKFQMYTRVLYKDVK
ncbi:hypothetical protein SK128_008035 [Halocaridina rubra]|uniref:Uncharacterized protein n=1 Tax=Halocaridina rubra TaxID=373956 RepID=A0AAN9A0C7_HALRR